MEEKRNSPGTASTGAPQPHRSDPAQAPQPPGTPSTAIVPAPGADAIYSLPAHPEEPLSEAEAASRRTVAEFEPVPLRPRHDGWTPARQRAFVEYLAETLSVETAAALVGMSPQGARELRRRPGAEGFAAACDAALRRGLAERGRAALIDEAVNGRLVRRFYHGEIVSEERVRSPRLLLALLDKAEALFAGPGAAESAAMAADWAGAMERLEEGAYEGGFRLWRDRDGAWWTNFPPPPGFRDHEGDPAAPDFRRRLSEAEEKALATRARERLRSGEQARDAFFGFSPGRGVTHRRIRSKGAD
jgi:hypothetical protein